MTGVPALSGREIVRALGVIGYRVVRRRGSHFRLSCPGKKSVTVPDYRMIGKGLLRKILRDVDISPEEFAKLR